MSVKVIAWVWDHSLSEGTDRLVLLAIADNAGHDGSNAWPTLGELSRKTRLSERTIQRCIRNLERIGELRIESNKGGTPGWDARYRPNRYSVLMRGDKTTPLSDPGVTNQVVRGDRSGSSGVTPVSSKPSLTVINQKSERARREKTAAKARELIEMLAAKKATDTRQQLEAGEL